MSRITLLACLLTLSLAATASAAPVTKTYRYGPITVAGYEVKQADLVPNIPKPDVDGAITAMSVDVTDAKGTPVPISRLMLHHIVFANLGTTLGEKRDPTCGGGFTRLDSLTKFPSLAERFYAAGEERAEMQLPPGYGYPGKATDRWFMTWMLMNHRATSDSAYIQYKVTVDDDPALKPVKPYWLDVKNCLADPVFDAPGGDKPGSTFAASSTYAMPEGSRIVAAAGHVHGGAKNLVLSSGDCRRRLLGSEPSWGTAKHPFYTVKPVLHEPGPIHMSGTLSAQGFPVAAGERLTLTANYDNERPHTRAMGILIMYAAPDPGVTQPCGPMPTDVRTVTTTEPHRTTSPIFTVPLTGLDAAGKAVSIDAPPGRRKRLASGATVTVKNFAFTTGNIDLRRGASLRWKFQDADLHDVTLASGPRGFSSVHLNNGRTYSRKFGTAGTYRIFCSLHPVRMTQSVRVR